MSTKKPLTWFVITYLIFQLIVILMRNDEQVFWHIMTGLMLFASVSYLFYERSIESKRIPTSVGVGIAASFAIVIVHALISYIIKDVHYFHILKTLVTVGVYYKWQLIITMVVTIPLHELYMRTMLQQRLMEHTSKWAAVLITSLASALLFVWTLNLELVLFIFVIQCILAVSYAYTKRLITPMIGQILAIIILILIHAR